MKSITLLKLDKSINKLGAIVIQRFELVKEQKGS